MTRDEAVALLEDRLGKRGTAFDTQIVAELKAAQIAQEHKPTLPWFLLYYDTALVTIADTKTLAIPTGFLMEDDYSHMHMVDTSGKYTRVRKGDYDALRGSSLFDTAAFPERFALQGKTLHFFPTPDAAYAIDWHYYKADTVLSTDVTNSWLTHAPDVLMSQTGMRIAHVLRDPGLVATFKEDYNEALVSMWHHDEARRQAALDTVMGG